MTTEFIDAPVISSALYNSTKSTLTNITNSNIALQFFDRDGVLVNPASGSTFDAVVQFLPESYVYYDDIVIQQATSIDYNVPKVNSYINDQILSHSITPLPLPVADTLNIQGGNHVLSVNSTGLITKTINQSSINNNHLQIYTATDVNNNLACIVYRDKEGLSYSLDGGLSIIPIANTGLLYPLEITSVVIQVYSNKILSSPSPVIYVGTLREGIKSFAIGGTEYAAAPGMDSYILLEDGAGAASTTTITVDAINYTINNIQYIFKHSVATNSAIKPTIDSNSGLYLSHTAGDFAPVWLLGLLNYPIDSGSPLICYTRSNIERYSTLGTYDKITRYLSLATRPSVKYYSLDSTYGIYRQSDDTSYTTESGWRVLQETFNSVTTINPYLHYSNTAYANFGLTLSSSLPSTLVDVVRSTPINTSNECTSTNSGVCTIIDDASGAAKIVKFVSTTRIGASSRTLTISQISTNGTAPTDITGFTSYWSSSEAEFQLFLTTTDTVKRYYNSAWTTFINSAGWDSDNPTINLQLTHYLQTFYDPTTDSPSIGGALPTDIKTHLTGLKEFSLLNIGSNKHIGILGSDLGYVVLYFIKKIDDFVSPMSTFREFKFSIYPSWSTDLVFVPEARKIVSCTLQKQPPILYEAPTVATDPPIKYYQYDPTLASYGTKGNAIKSKIFYRNYGTTGETKYYFYNSYNNAYYSSNSLNFDQYSDDIYNVERIRVIVNPSQANITGIKYAADALNSTPYTFLSSAGINNDTALVNYLITNPNKYKHLKILLRTVQTLSNVWNDACSVSDTIYTYFLQK